MLYSASRTLQRALSVANQGLYPTTLLADTWKHHVPPDDVQYVHPTENEESAAFSDPLQDLSLFFHVLLRALELALVS